MFNIFRKKSIFANSNPIHYQKISFAKPNPIHLDKIQLEKPEKIFKSITRIKYEKN